LLIHLPTRKITSPYDITFPLLSNSDGIKKAGCSKHYCTKPTNPKPTYHVRRNDTLRAADFTDKSSGFNQGIVDGRPEGSQPAPASVTLDTVVDPDASADDPALQHPPASSTVTGVTSKEVYHGLGVPAQGMSSKEAHHDGQPGRKRQGEGVEQFGEGALY
ncbi:hypothetical protein EDD16DRAFT_1543917, partial [Pisolithus croceorrhizus]